MPDRPYSSDLSDAEWAVLRPLLPPPSLTGRPLKWPRPEMAEAIFYLGRSGCAWRMLPRHFPRSVRSIDPTEIPCLGSTRRSGIPGGCERGLGADNRMGVDEQLAGGSDQDDVGRLAGVLEALHEVRKDFVGARGAERAHVKHALQAFIADTADLAWPANGRAGALLAG